MKRLKDGAVKDHLRTYGSDLDIWRSANLLVKCHSEDAPIHAAMRADAMLEACDLGGLTTWNPPLPLQIHDATTRNFGTQNP